MILFFTLKTDRYPFGIEAALGLARRGATPPQPYRFSTPKEKNMRIEPTFPHRIAAAALIAAALGLASPAFASRNDGHSDGDSSHTDNSNDGSGHTDSSNDGSSHTDGSNDGSSHTDDHGNSANSTGTPASRTGLVGTVEPGARGEAKLKQKRRGNQFEAEVKLPVPSAALAIADRSAAQDATLTLSLGRLGVAYAECDFDLKSFKSRSNRPAYAEYKLEVADRGGVIQTRSGICDVNLATPGIQSGIPAIQAGDTATVTIDTNGVSFLEGVF